MLKEEINQMKNFVPLKEITNKKQNNSHIIYKTNMRTCTPQSKLN